MRVSKMLGVLHVYRYRKRHGHPFDYAPYFVLNDRTSDFAKATPDKSQGKPYFANATQGGQDRHSRVCTGWKPVLR